MRDLIRTSFSGFERGPTIGSASRLSAGEVGDEREEPYYSSGGILEVAAWPVNEHAAGTTKHTKKEELRARASTEGVYNRDPVSAYAEKGLNI